MNRITKKEFIETLESFSSVFCGSVFRWNDEKIVKVLENFKPEQMEKIGERSVTEKHGNYIVFSNGSRLGFNQDGKKEYFSYRGQNGIFYIMQRLSHYDEFDDMEYLDYIIYAIPEKMETPKTEESRNGKFEEAENMKNDRMYIQDSRVINMIENMDAKRRIRIFDSETEKSIFDGYIYQTYDNKELTEKLRDLYIADMLIDYDGIRILSYDKWKK